MSNNTQIAGSNFVTKLFNLVNDTSVGDIYWSETGSSFLFINPTERGFATLKNYFKHGNISSFVRQLNKYNFRKIKRHEVDVWEFMHECFKRGRPDLLVQIKRKSSESKCGDSDSSGEMDGMYNLLKEVAQNQKDLSISIQTLARQQRMMMEEIQGMHKLYYSMIQGNSCSEEFSSETVAKPSIGSQELAPVFAKEKRFSLPSLGRIQDSASLPERVPWIVSPRVLLVEDDPICRKIGSKMLEMMGCKITAAADGLEAIRQMQNREFDIVLMDIRMPNLDGLSATKHIRQHDQKTPIISMTAHFTEQDCLSYLATGMNDILEKPLSKESFIALINRYCYHLKMFDERRPQAYSGLMISNK